jgi:predicted RecB family nuclease
MAVSGEVVATGVGSMTVPPIYQSNTHYQSNTLEFVHVASRAGIDLSAMVDPRTELSFAVACRICRTCTWREKCRRALRESNAPLSSVTSFCPCADLLVELMSRSGPARAA